jgi:hypothetical protein
VTLVTIALSINQLILSRVFGSPNELFDQLSGTRDLRRRIREHAGEPSVPNDPAEFLNLVAETLTERATRLGSASEDADHDQPRAVDEYASGIAAYGESISTKIESQTAIVNVLEVILGTEYARNMTATEHLRNAYGDRLSDAAEAELDVIEDLLESIAVTRRSSRRSRCSKTSPDSPAWSPTAASSPSPPASRWRSSTVPTRSRFRRGRSRSSSASASASS